MDSPTIHKQSELDSTSHFLNNSSDGPTTTINLGGENTAGHPRKVASIDFGGVIDVTAPSVIIQAESWFQKMTNQKKRFPAKKTEAESQFRFY